jgi:hypothetical protein
MNSWKFTERLKFTPSCETVAWRHCVGVRSSAIRAIGFVGRLALMPKKFFSFLSACRTFTHITIISRLSSGGDPCQVN